MIISNIHPTFHAYLGTNYNQVANNNISVYSRLYSFCVHSPEYSGLQGLYIMARKEYYGLEW